MEKQRYVLITGAAGGVGKATVQLFTEKGWRVIGVDRSAYGGTYPENGLFIRPILPTLFSLLQSMPMSGNLLRRSMQW